MGTPLARASSAMDLAMPAMPLAPLANVQSKTPTAIIRVLETFGWIQPKTGAITTNETMKALCNKPFSVSEWEKPNWELMGAKLALMMYLSM